MLSCLLPSFGVHTASLQHPQRLQHIPILIQAATRRRPPRRGQTGDQKPVRNALSARETLLSRRARTPTYGGENGIAAALRPRFCTMSNYRRRVQPRDPICAVDYNLWIGSDSADRDLGERKRRTSIARKPHTPIGWGIGRYLWSLGRTSWFTALLGVPVARQGDQLA